MIDLTTGHEAISFMDCIAKYNQIQMAPEGQEAMTFRTSNGVFYYNVIAFSLENTGNISKGNVKYF